ncbi:MAG TPA: tRNA 2-thiouridine(34) synthase MnmA [Acidimicrobiales bacterium]|nr:tRNA 2-thiouridine(34) synthase MnmA [Acidimicrobiales bacterium]
MRVLAAMSGGVDSSVTAALLVDAGHDVVGATMKLWGGPSDQGCCSIADVDDARRVCQQLGIAHHVFNFSGEFDAAVVAPYVEAHRAGVTPNPCIECNRHMKFDRFLARGIQLGFDAVATGHHARVAEVGGGWRLLRGFDRAKDQSYVLHMLDQATLPQVLLPVGEMTKEDVRRVARDRGLRTAAKADSQDTCFLPVNGGRAKFLGDRTTLTPGRLVDTAGHPAGEIAAVELVTVGQRRGLGSGHDEAVYAVDVDVATATVTIGTLAELHRAEQAVGSWTWVHDPVEVGSQVEVQTSAHGAPTPAIYTGAGVAWSVPQRRVAPGQSVVLYTGDAVLGGGIAT